MGYPEDRTHSEHSAVDDEMIPVEDRAEAADAEQAPSGMEAIPADMPNSPHGDIPFEYTLQNFNALVAANTAMQTAIAAAEERAGERLNEIGRLEIEVKHLREVIGESLQPAIAALKKATDGQEQVIFKREKTIEQLDAELKFARDQRDTLQRRLDRSLGYMDRVLDEEDGMRAPDTRTAPAPRPPVGPALGEIPDARRPEREDRISAWAPASVGFEDGSVRRRRY